ncbi:MAG: NAD-binding protein, partial [Desulfopila sp.]|nr:NAD-binding protein [Desulfopila sp.]
MEDLSNGPVWIIGGGKFGRQAAESLLRKKAANHIVLVDIQPDRLLPEGVEYICGDGIAWLTEHLPLEAEVGAIIPAVPFHLAAEWLKKRLSLDGFSVETVNLPDYLL